MSSCPIPPSSVAEQLRKHIEPGSPAPLRLMAAKGMVPMGGTAQPRLLKHTAPEARILVAPQGMFTLLGKVDLSVRSGTIRAGVNTLILGLAR